MMIQGTHQQLLVPWILALYKNKRAAAAGLQLEDWQQPGIYPGCIGYCSLHRATQSNIRANKWAVHSEVL